MKNKKKIILVISILIIFIGIVIWIVGYSYISQYNNQDIIFKKVKIGFIAPLTGARGVYGQAVQDGINLAKKDLKADSVEIFFEDSQCDPVLAISAVDNLIKIRNVQVIIGDICSSATLAVSPVMNQNKVILISPGSTSPDITEAGEYVFRTIQSDAFQGEFGADLVYRNGGKRLAIIYTDESYGQGLKDILTKNFRGKVVSIQGIDQSGGDIRVQLFKIKSASPDSIYVITNGSRVGGSVIKQIRDVGIVSQIYGSEGLKGDDIFDLAGESAEGLIVTSTSFGTDIFQEHFLKEYSRKPGIFVAQGYDAFTAIYKTIEQGAIIAKDIKDKLILLDFEGVSGHILFDKNGDIKSDYIVYKVNDGKFIKQN